MSKNYLSAIATMVGSIVGVGMFSVPYVVEKAGLLTFFIYLPVMALVQYFIHKLYAEIILSTKTKHRVPGYVEKYIGHNTKELSLFIVLIASNLGILAYVIVGGIFFHELLNPILGGGVMLYTILMLSLGALSTFSGLKLISKIETWMLLFMFLVIGLIVARGVPEIHLANYTWLDLKYAFLPYGPIFFAIGGTSAIPCVCNLLSEERKNIKKAIFWGSLIPVALLFVFTLVVVGVTGPNTTQAALKGLSHAFGNSIARIVLIFGILTIGTSYIVGIQSLREIYWWDLKMKKSTAWVLAVFVPYLLYVIGLNNATKVIGLTGSITGGIIGMFYIILGIKVKYKKEREPETKVNVNRKVAIVLSFIFAFGLIYELYSIFK